MTRKQPSGMVKYVADDVVGSFMFAKEGKVKREIAATISQACMGFAEKVMGFCILDKSVKLGIDLFVEILSCLEFVAGSKGLPRLNKPCPQGLRRGTRRRCGLGEKMWILLLELVLTFPGKLSTSFRVPSNLYDGNATPL
ncbi:hypothetical protein Tco_0140250 [Tanacetum coccineum]